MSFVRFVVLCFRRDPLVHFNRTQVRSFTSFRRWRRRSTPPRHIGRIPHVHRTAAVLGHLEHPVNVLIEVVGPVMLLHPIADVCFLIVGENGRRIPEAEHFVRRRCRLLLALLRHLPLLPHDTLQVLQEIRRWILQLLRTRQSRTL